jgi:predicted DNA-binding transcriptional regulator YafY
VKSDRLLSLLLLLQGHGRLSARRLAERLEVTERTIHRDVEALSAAGVPVYAERGRNGGIALLPGYRTDVSGLSAGEAKALFIFAGRGSAAADLGLETELRGALRKLLAALPAPTRPGAEEAQQRLVVDPRGWLRPSEELPWLGVIQEAVWAGRKLRLSYRRAGAEAAGDRVVDTYGLVSKAGTWYLIAGDAGEPRLYRVSRVQSAEQVDQPALRPAGLDLDELWQELRRRFEERGPGVEVELRVRRDRSEMLLRLARSQLTTPPEGEPEAEPGGWVRHRLRFVAEGAAQGLLLGFGTDVEVLSPASLRASMAATAAAVAGLYASQQGGSPRAGFAEHVRKGGRPPSK